MTVSDNRMQQNFSRSAFRYDEHAWLQQQQTSRVLAAALQRLPEIGNVLDLGCGTGLFALAAALERPKWHITGVDFSFEMARYAARRCDAVVQANATKLPFPDNSVDAAVSSLCLQWVNDKRAMLSEMRRVLKPGGTAILTTLGAKTLNELRRAAEKSEVELGILDMLPANTYKLLAADAGLQIIGFQSTHETQYYPSVEALLRSLKAIGANNAQAGKRRFLSPKRFAHMIHHYESLYAGPLGVPASWEPILLMLRKAA